ncbi:MAG: hypothetical protein K8R59_15100 [Thermoanaerobaculales bacterium]|nr:hypothetical protein [Thermoanaerobaculales bacterium]
MSLLRRGISNIYVAAAVALLVTGAIGFLDGFEERRIEEKMQFVAAAGNSLDDQIEVYAASFFRSTRVYFPVLVVFSGGLIGLLCRNRKFVWTAVIFGIFPIFVMTGALLSQWPLNAGLTIGVYILLGLAPAVIVVVLRNRFSQVE